MAATILCESHNDDMNNNITGDKRYTKLEEIKSKIYIQVYILYVNNTEKLF